MALRRADKEESVKCALKILILYTACKYVTSDARTEKLRPLYVSFLKLEV